MTSRTSIGRKIISVLTPTLGQTLFAVLIALVIVIAVNIHQVFILSGIDRGALDTVLGQYNQHTSGFLTTKAAGSAALITFWAMIGMAAYLICWCAYNLMIEARNEVTLTTQYTNQGRRAVNFVSIGIKIISAALLLGVIALQRPGFDFWLTMAQPAFQNLSLINILTAAGAVLGLAAQLYLIFAMIVATFTPWYRK